MSRMQPYYSAQEMLTTYRSGNSVGDGHWGDPSAAAGGGGLSAGAGSAISGVATLVTGLIGLGVQGSANKKNRAHEQEMAALQLQSNALAAKSAEAGAMAQATAALAANKRAITYASAGFASVALIGALWYLSKRKRG
jgi:hypothetical protein